MHAVRKRPPEFLYSYSDRRNFLRAMGCAAGSALFGLRPDLAIAEPSPEIIRLIAVSSYGPQ
jgi:hypothetical protein